MRPHDRRQVLPSITPFARSHWLGLPRREAPFVGLLLAAALMSSGSARALEAASSSPANESLSKAQTYEVLRERVRTEPLKELSDEWFQVLITGRRLNGVIWTDVALADPPDPNTLTTNFAQWNLTARASLLLSYAKLVTTSPSPDPVGLSVEQPGAILPKDAARIAQVVHTGGYADAWQQFVVAYVKWLGSVEATLPPGDSPDDPAIEKLFARLAGEQGLLQLVRGIRIDPGDVANEMLRLVENFRVTYTVPTQVNEHDPNLFYVCDTEATEVHVHPWHRLAPAFFQAWEAADKKRQDPKALLVMKEFEGLAKDMKSWVAAHPKADERARDRALNTMAVARGLYALLEKEESE